MQTLILTLHIIVCFLLVILILLQSGKEGMGVIFGGGNSSVFGSSGAGGILAKLTTLMAIIFVITSLSYTYVTSSRPASDSAVLNVRIEEAPATQKQAEDPKTVTPEKTTQAAPEPAKAAPEAAPAPQAKPAPGDASTPAAGTTPSDKPAENK